MYDQYQMYDQYKEKIDWVQKIGPQSHDIEDIKQELKKAQDTLSMEIDFVSRGMLNCMQKSLPTHVNVYLCTCNPCTYL